MVPRIMVARTSWGTQRCIGFTNSFSDIEIIIFDRLETDNDIEIQTVSFFKLFKKLIDS